MNKNDVTIGQAYESLALSVNEYVSDGVMVSENIAIYNLAIQQDVNFRDLLMGLPKHYDMDKCIGFITYTLGQVDTLDRTPYLTVLSAYAYELGDVTSAYKYLSDAVELDPNYSLAKLLARVFASGWPAQSLASMRDELDIKVRENVESQREILISELV
jgi:tetratricopeptide (TPR) repeat protein